MKKSLENFKVSPHFYLYEFIEGSQIAETGARLNWEYLNSLTEIERGVFIQLVQMACNKLEEVREFANNELNAGGKIGIKVKTGLRCLKYELMMGRNGSSQHCQKIAVDFILTNITNNMVYDSLMQLCYLWIDGSKVKRWMSGLARKVDGSRDRKWRFIHIDFRTAKDKHLKRGYGARWEY